jgi:hypothetical protein
MGRWTSTEVQENVPREQARGPVTTAGDSRGIGTICPWIDPLPITRACEEKPLKCPHKESSFKDSCSYWRAHILSNWKQELASKLAALPLQQRPCH